MSPLRLTGVQRRQNGEASTPCCGSWTSPAQILTHFEANTAIDVLVDEAIERLMTIPGVNATVAVSVATAHGDFPRFE